MYLHTCSPPDTQTGLQLLLYLAMRQSESINSDLLPSPRELLVTYAVPAVKSYTPSSSVNNSEMDLLPTIH